MGKLIINADDYGISHEVNLAIQKGIRERIIDRATLMVNMPFAEEAVDMAKDGGYLNRIGLHINLVEGEPLSYEIKKSWLCSDGYMNGKISNKKYKTGFIKDKKALCCIEEEIDAQMQRFLSWGMPLLHVDSHQHSHIKPSIFPIFMKLAKKYRFTSIRLAALIQSDNPKFKTKLYKTHVNYQIKKYNKKHYDDKTEFPLIDIGCSYDSLKKELSNNKSSITYRNIETWFHPYLENDHIINLFSKEDFNTIEMERIKQLVER